MNAPLVLTRRHVFAAWILVSTLTAIIGAFSPWFTVSTVLGSLSLSGTYIGSKASGGSFGAGWEVLAVTGVAAGIALIGLLQSLRWPLPLAALLSVLAVADVVYVMVRSASALLHSTQYATASWGWGIVLALVGSASLSVAILVTLIRSGRREAPTLDNPETAVRRGRVLGVVSVIALLAVASAAAEGLVLARKQTSLNDAREKLAAVPTQISAARSSAYSTGYEDGVSAEDQKYSGCYTGAYQDGYLKGWDAAVSELKAVGYVQGGASDPWWDNTTFASCSGPTG